MPYVNFKPYIFYIPTTCSLYKQGCKQETVCGWDPGPFECDGLDRSIIEYMNTNVANGDLRNRLARMLVAIEKSILFDYEREKFQVGNTLKIFVAPEFYFRMPYLQQVAGNDYSLEDYYQLTAAFWTYFETFPKIHPDIPLKDWLFMCGTCVHYERSGCLKNEIMMFYFRSQGNLSLREVRKVHTSGIDGIYGDKDWNRSGTLFERKDPIMERFHYLDEPKIIVEICVEHLYDTTKQLAMRYPGVKMVVLMAAGMPVKDDDKHLVPHVQYARCDGMFYGGPETMTEMFETDIRGRKMPQYSARNRVSVCAFTTIDMTTIPSLVGMDGYVVVGPKTVATPTVFCYKL